MIPSSDLKRFSLIICQVAPKANTFMPFGSGIHACPGNELAKLEILVLLHHLTTKYRLVNLLITSNSSQQCNLFYSIMGIEWRHIPKLERFTMFLKCVFAIIFGAGGLLWVQRMGFSMVLLLSPKMACPSHYIPRSRYH